MRSTGRPQRSDSQITSSMDGQGKPFCKRRLSANPLLNRFRLLRAWHRFTHLFHRSDKVSLSSLQRTQLFSGKTLVERNVALATQKPVMTAEVRDKGVGFAVKVDDKALAEDLGSVHYQVMDERAQPPLTGAGLNISDIQQADKRSDCYFLSSLASLLATEGGASALQDLIQVDDESVTVTLTDPFDNKTIAVTVSRDRLLDEKGNDLYSVGAPWVRYFEKAFHGYRLYKVKELEGFLSSPNATNIQKADASANLPNLKGGSRNLLDYGASSHAYRALSTAVKKLAPDGEKQFSRLGQQPLPAHSNKVKQLVKQNVPMTLSKRAGLKDIGQAATKGLVTHHTYAVVGEATKCVSEKDISGVLVFDPYGKSVGALPELSSDDDRVYKLSPTFPVRFYSYDELDHLFSEGIVPAWGAAALGDDE